MGNAIKNVSIQAATDAVTLKTLEAELDDLLDQTLLLDWDSIPSSKRARILIIEEEIQEIKKRRKI